MRKQRYQTTPIVPGSDQNKHTVSSPAWNASQIRPETLDLSTDEGINSLAHQFRTEYQTLAEHRDELLANSRGQYVAIQGNQWIVRPTLDEAVGLARSTFPQGLFFLGRISEADLHDYLSVTGQG